MNIGILGSGSLGLLFASHLQTAGARPLCLAHSPASAIALQKGISIRHNGRETLYRPDSTKIPADLLNCDLILVCVKAWQAEAAAAELAAVAGLGGLQAPLLVSLMNGLHAELPFRQSFGQQLVVAGLSYAAANRPSPETLIIAGLGPTLLPLAAGRTGEKLQRLTQLFEAGGLPCSQVQDIDRAIWTKAIINSAINPVAGLAAIPNGELLAKPDLLKLSTAVIKEAAAVAAAEGIVLPTDQLYQQFLQTCQATAANRCSMLADLQAGRPTEVNWLNGSIVQLAERHRLAADTNRELWQTVLARSREKSGQPE
ncbi:MAG: ketopantoate reductase family protein [Spirochaetes bacterium]|nr:ketopantoate reductase family protein [Spirochaetota bacterium]